MLSIKERPHVLLFYTAIAIFIALVFPIIAAMDFQYITMFSIPLDKMVLIIPLILTSLWLSYLQTKRFLYSMTFSWIHVLITISSTILIVIFLFIGINPGQTASHSYFETLSVDRQEFIGNTMQILSILFVCSQFIYLANVLLGVFKKTNK
jgi:hypothetical protein